MSAESRQVVERYWDAHFRRDWDAMAAFYNATCHYTDVGLDPTGATGPEEIVLRLLPPGELAGPGAQVVARAHRRRMALTR